MEPTTAINAISLTVIVLSLLSIRRGKREVRRIGEARRTREGARTITKVDASVLPAHVGYDGRAAQAHGPAVSVYLGKAVALDDYPPGATGYQDFALGEVYDLEHHFDEGLFVTGEDRWAVARAVVRQWGAAGFDALAVGSNAECLAELWGAPATRFALGSAAAAASQEEVLEELERRYLLCQHHGVDNLLSLPEAVRPERLLLVVAVESFGEDDFEKVSKTAVTGVVVFGRAVGVHLLVVVDPDQRDNETGWLRSVRNNCAVVRTGFIKRQAGHYASELGAGWDAPHPGRAAYGRSGDCAPLQAAVSPRQALPVGWSTEDLTLAVAAGWSPTMIEAAGTPTDSVRAAWQMLAALRG